MVEDKFIALKEQIKTIYARHKGRYGYRRITAAIRMLGTRVNHKTVQVLMGKMGLKSLVRRRNTAPTRGLLAKQRQIF